MPPSAPGRVERAAGVLPFGHLPRWDGVVERAHAAEDDNLRGPALELEREAVVIAFCLYLSADPPGRAGALARTTVRQLATMAGLREDRVRRCLTRLAAGGVLHDADGAPLSLVESAPAWDDGVVGRIAESLLRPAPTSRAIRWDEVRRRAGGSTRALAATAAFLDLLPLAGEWTCVPLGAVGSVARYAGRKVGEAVQRAVECGVIEERRERGSASLYRFAAAVLHGSPIEGSSDRRIVAVADRESSGHLRGATPGAGSPIGAPTPRPGEMRPVEAAATLMVAGVPLPLPPGARPQLEQDAAGRYWYRIGTAHFGPVEID